MFNQTLNPQVSNKIRDRNTLQYFNPLSDNVAHIQGQPMWGREGSAFVWGINQPKKLRKFNQ